MVKDLVKELIEKYKQIIEKNENKQRGCLLTKNKMCCIIRLNGCLIV